MSEGKAVLYTLGGVAAVLSAVMWLTSESSEDLARKPELVKTVLATSLQRCDLQSKFSQTASYEDRLREVLDETRSLAMDFLIANDITVCLDRRIAEVDAGFWDQEAHAFYYPDQNVVTIYDNGDDYNHTSTFETSASSYGDGLLNEFHSDYESYNGGIETVSSIQLGYHYSGKVSGEAWKNDATRFDVIKENPSLLEPPLAFE